MASILAKIMMGAMPDVGARTALVIACLGFAVFAFGATWLAGATYGASGKLAAISECNMKWRAAISNMEADYARKIEEARAAADAVVSVPADDAGVDRMCKQSPACRDRSGGEASGR